MTDTETNREAETGIDATTGADAGAETADADTEPETADAEPDRDATPVPIADPNSALTPSGGSNPSSRTGDWRTDRKSGPSKRSSRPTGTDDAVATANGTTALHAALEAIGLEDGGDAVITSPFSFVASANAIRLAGGNPVFADIDPETYTLDPADVERVLAERDDIVGILPVHLYGLPADMPALCDIADEFDLFVLEDACQAHGAKVDGERVGTFGDAAACFSFYPTKNMTTAEGGMIVTDRDDVAERAASYVNHGRNVNGTGGYDHVALGHNFRMTSIEAAIGRVQLERLSEFNRAVARTPPRTTSGSPTSRSRRRRSRPALATSTTSIRFERTIETPSRQPLADRDVGTGIYYETPIHHQPAYLRNGQHGRGARPPARNGRPRRCSHRPFTRACRHATGRLSSKQCGITLPANEYGQND